MNQAFHLERLEQRISRETNRWIEKKLQHQNKYSDTANFDRDQYTNISQHSLYQPHLNLCEFPLSRNYIFCETSSFKSSKTIHNVVTTALNIRQSPTLFPVKTRTSESLASGVHFEVVTFSKRNCQYTGLLSRLTYT
jgi:hypothetical protein